MTKSGPFSSSPLLFYFAISRSLLFSNRPKEEALRFEPSTSRANASNQNIDTSRGDGDYSSEGGYRNQKQDWLLEVDFNYIFHSSSMIMTPFVWTPKIIYFTRHEDSFIANQDKLRTEQDIFGEQIELMKIRLREIESSIRYYLEIQKGLVLEAIH